jgi:hypothetical protein
MSDFFDRQFEKEKQEQKAFAESLGYTVKNSSDLWRVYEPPIAGIPAEMQHSQIAICFNEGDAVKVAYALARLKAGAQ